MYNKLKYYFELWKKHVNKEKKIKEKLGNIFDKKEAKENMKSNLALKKWLYNAQMIKFDINKIRIGFFCKKILDIKVIIDKLKKYFGIKSAMNSINDSNRKNVLKKLFNDYLRNQWEQKMKDILDFTNENNKSNYLHTYLKFEQDE